jgi:hypothetical protein
MQREIIMLTATPETITMLNELERRTGKGQAQIFTNALAMYDLLVNECGENARVVYEKDGKTTMRPLFKKED